LEGGEDGGVLFLLPLLACDGNCCRCREEDVDDEVDFPASFSFCTIREYDAIVVVVAEDFIDDGNAANGEALFEPHRPPTTRPTGFIDDCDDGMPIIPNAMTAWRFAWKMTTRSRADRETPRNRRRRIDLRCRGSG
jgi:hypothetical protein